MKAIITSILILFSAAMFGQIAWINEFHYANYGTDVNEFVEIVVRNTGEWEEENYFVTFYNNEGIVYMNYSLAEFQVGDTVADCIVYYRRFEGDSIINSNGAISLCYYYEGFDSPISCLQFIGYGSIIYAIHGPAKERISKDVGHVQNTTTGPYESIQLGGDHFIWWGFEWGVDTMSVGSVNTHQTINPAPIQITYDSIQ